MSNESQFFRVSYKLGVTIFNKFCPNSKFSTISESKCKFIAWFLKMNIVFVYFALKFKIIEFVLLKMFKVLQARPFLTFLYYLFL